MNAPKSREALRKNSCESEQTVVLLGVVAMLLVAIIYIWLDISPDIAPSE
jgi:uncharacterized membrane protein YadS